MKPQLSLEAFADWCEKQPAREVYEFGDWERCACGQYAASMGIDTFDWFDKMLDDQIAGRANFWTKANRIAHERPHRFSALAARLRAVSQ